MMIELNCAVCGENRFTLGEHLTDACEVRCHDCGHAIGTLGELKDLFARAVVSRASTDNPDSRT